MNKQNPFDASKIKSAASEAARQVTEEPDKETQAGIEKDKIEKKKARNPTERAEILDDEMRNQTDWLRSELDGRRERVRILEERLEGFASTRVELAELKSPKRLKRSILLGSAFLGAVGAGLTAVFPYGGPYTDLVGMPSATVFGIGISFVFTAATITMLASLGR